MPVDRQAFASDFRKAIDSIDLSSAPGFLPRFPKGCCGWAAVFMGNYLKDVHGIEALHVMARHPSKNYGHEWLELESDVIEITLDQFGATLPKAYSGPALSFHRELKVQSKDVVSRIGKFDMIRGIEDVYRTIVSQMKTSDGR